MSDRQSSWEIILVGVVLTVLAIYFFFFSSTISHQNSPGIDSTKTLVVNIANILSLKKIDSLDHAGQLDKYDSVLVKFGRFSRTFDLHHGRSRHSSSAIPGIDSVIESSTNNATEKVDSVLAIKGSVVSTQQFNSKNIHAVDLHTTAGQIAIRGDSAKAITLVISTNKKNVTPKSFRRDFDVTTRTDGDRLTVHIQPRHHITSLFGFFGAHGGLANITILVPHSIDVTAHSSAGQIKAEDLKGTLDLSTSAGEIRLDSVSGDVHAHTDVGHISTDYADGHLTLTASQGALNLSHTTGSINASTSAGAIIAAVDKITGDIDLSTSMGTIIVNIPSDFKSNVNLSGTSVSIEEGLKISGKISSKDVVGGLNGGGDHTLKATTSIGRITLSTNK